MGRRRESRNRSGSPPTKFRSSVPTFRLRSVQKVREAIEASGRVQGAYLVSDRTVELNLHDGRSIRITAAENLKSGGYSAVHEKAVEMQQGGDIVIAWGYIDLPWAVGDTIEECLASAILLLHSP
jgi:hypothetical protein